MAKLAHDLRFALEAGDYLLVLRRIVCWKPLIFDSFGTTETIGVATLNGKWADLLRLTFHFVHSPSNFHPVNGHHVAKLADNSKQAKRSSSAFERYCVESDRHVDLTAEHFGT